MPDSALIHQPGKYVIASPACFTLADALHRGQMRHLYGVKAFGVAQALAREKTFRKAKLFKKLDVCMPSGGHLQCRAYLTRFIMVAGDRLMWFKRG
jgi:hypothetical protein